MAFQSPKPSIPEVHCSQAHQRSWCIRAITHSSHDYKSPFSNLSHLTYPIAPSSRSPSSPSPFLSTWPYQSSAVGALGPTKKPPVSLFPLKTRKTQGPRGHQLNQRPPPRRLLQLKRQQARQGSLRYGTKTWASFGFKGKHEGRRDVF